MIDNLERLLKKRKKSYCIVFNKNNLRNYPKYYIHFHKFQ